MTRNLLLSNGRLLVNFDRHYHLRDLCWPHVGQENHTEGHPFRFGVYAEDQFSWIADDSWEKEIRYEDDTLAGHITVRHQDLGLTLVCRDIVDFQDDLYLRIVEVADSRPARTGHSASRPVRLFFTHDFHIHGSKLGDTAYYEPELKAVLHYKRNCWFLIDVGRRNDDRWTYGVDQWNVGKEDTGERDVVWRDAEDGELSGGAVAQGSIGSVVALHLEVPAGGRAVGGYWICVGRDFQAAAAVDEAVRTKQPEAFLGRTQAYWNLWVRRDQADEEELPPRFAALYRRSLLVVREQADEGGGIVAATDFDTARHVHDTYAYVWPRDGALATTALIHAGYIDVAEKFFRFCHSVITPQGYLLHKYNPDGSLASSWEPWYYEGNKVLPIQEDETALVLWALRLHFERFHSVEFVKALYPKLILSPANWLADYVDDQGLIQPSWDLWEERRGIHAWTAATVWAALQAAARFARDFGHRDLAARYTQAADRLKEAVAGAMWDREENHFVRTLEVGRDGHRSMDKTLDSSLMGLWYFGMFDAADPRITATMEAVRQRLWVNSPVGGIARYENDQYYTIESSEEPVPGNPWFVCTLWLAQWYIRKARTAADLQPAADLIRWTASRTLPSGLMAEQIHPFTGEPLSACPLTWSHSTFVLTVHEYLTKCRELQCSADSFDDENTDHPLDQEVPITHAEGAVL